MEGLEGGREEGTEGTRILRKKMKERRRGGGRVREKYTGEPKHTYEESKRRETAMCIGIIQ